MKRFRYFWQFNSDDANPNSLTFLRVGKDLKIDKPIYRNPKYLWTEKGQDVRRSWLNRSDDYIWNRVLHNERQIVKIIFRAHWSTK